MALLFPLAFPRSSEQGMAEDLSLPFLHSNMLLSPLLAWSAWMGLDRAGGLGWGFLAVLAPRPSIDPHFLLPQHLLLFPN